MIGTEPVELRVLVERLESLAGRRLASGPRSEASVARARQLADLLHGHIRVRAASLDDPLVVLQTPADCEKPDDRAEPLDISRSG